MYESNICETLTVFHNDFINKIHNDLNMIANENEREFTDEDVEKMKQVVEKYRQKHVNFEIKDVDDTFGYSCVFLKRLRNQMTLHINDLLDCILQDIEAKLDLRDDYKVTTEEWTNES